MKVEKQPQPPTGRPRTVRAQRWITNRVPDPPALNLEAAADRPPPQPPHLAAPPRPVWPRVFPGL